MILVKLATSDRYSAWEEEVSSCEAARIVVAGYSMRGVADTDRLAATKSATKAMAVTSLES
jgi:hypothetical protein